MISKKQSRTSSERYIYIWLNLLRSSWPILSLLSIAAYLFSRVYIPTLPAEWLGSFQVDSSDKGSSTSSLGNSLLGNVLASRYPTISQGGGSIVTKMALIKTPFVLKRAFHDYKRMYNAPDLDFESWVSRINIRPLQKSTSLLEVSYKHTNRDQILPVMQLLERDIIDFSIRDSKVGAANQLAFLKEKLVEREKAYLSSLNKLQSFVEKNQIIEKPQSSPLISSSPLSAVTPKNLPYSLASPALKQNSSQNSSLANIDLKLLELRQVFKDTDPLIRELLLRKKALSRYNDVTADGLLSIEGSQYMTKQAATDLANKYKELSNQLSNNESDFRQIANSYRLLEFGAAKEVDPWIVVYPSRISPKPVSPNIKRLTNLFILIGIVVGMVFSACHVLLKRRLANFWEAELFLGSRPLFYAKRSQLDSTLLKLSLKQSLITSPFSSFIYTCSLDITAAKTVAALANDLSKADQIILLKDIYEPTCTGDFILLLSRQSSDKKLLRSFISSSELNSSRMVGWIWLD